MTWFPYPAAPPSASTSSTRPIEATLEALPLFSEAEREALARFGESLRHASHGLAEGLESLACAVIRAGEAFASFTLAVKAGQEDGE